MQREEAHRNKWALGLSVSLTVVIFLSFAFYKGFLSFGNDSTMAGIKSQNQVAAAASVPSPVENTKETFSAAFGEIGKQYQQFTDSVSAVLTPFFTGIEVYDRK